MAAARCSRPSASAALTLRPHGARRRTGSATAVASASARRRARCRRRSAVAASAAGAVAAGRLRPARGAGLGGRAMMPLAAVRHAQLRRRHPPHALPVRGPERAVRAPAVSPDRCRRLLDHRRRGGAAAAAAGGDGPGLARRRAAGRAHRRAPAADRRADASRAAGFALFLRVDVGRLDYCERAAAGARGRRRRPHAQRRAAHARR